MKWKTYCKAKDCHDLEYFTYVFVVNVLPDLYSYQTYEEIAWKYLMICIDKYNIYQSNIMHTLSFRIIIRILFFFLYVYFLLPVKHFLCVFPVQIDKVKTILLSIVLEVYFDMIYTLIQETVLIHDNKFDFLNRSVIWILLSLYVCDKKIK